MESLFKYKFYEIGYAKPSEKKEIAAPKKIFLMKK